MSAPKGMLWCRLCKDYAFIKTQLSSVASLDCGHMARPGEVNPPAKNEKHAHRAKPQIPPPTISPRREPPIPQPVQNTYQPPTRRTTNVAGTIKDLLDGLGAKSRTS